MSVRVLVADDEALVREGLLALLSAAADIEPVAAAADGEEAVALAARHRPDVVLMDRRMPKLNGVQATRQIRAAQPGTEVVVVTTYADEDSILDALQAARGYLTKDAGIAEIAGGLSNAEIAGQLVVSEATIKTHTNHLFAKTGARDRAQAVHYAYQPGLAG